MCVYGALKRGAHAYLSPTPHKIHMTHTQKTSEVPRGVVAAVWGRGFLCVSAASEGAVSIPYVERE